MKPVIYTSMSHLLQYSVFFVFSTTLNPIQGKVPQKFWTELGKLKRAVCGSNSAEKRAELQDVQALIAVKKGEEVPFQHADCMSERLYEEAKKMPACGRCHGCKPKQPISSDGQRPMTARQACARFRKGTCLRRECYLAVAAGKPGATLALPSEDDMKRGFRVKVGVFVLQICFAQNTFFVSVIQLVRHDCDVCQRFR